MIEAEREGFGRYTTSIPIGWIISLRSQSSSIGFRIPPSRAKYNKTQTKFRLCLGFGICGEGGIRTLEELAPLTVFKTVAINRARPPLQVNVRTNTITLFFGYTN